MMYQQMPGQFTASPRMAAGYGYARAASPRGVVGAVSPRGVITSPAAYGAGVYGAYGGQVVQMPYAQAAYAQPQVVAYGQQPAYAQPGMLAQPAPRPMTSQEKELSEKIDSYANYSVYMNAVKPYFDKIAGGNTRLSMQQVQRFQDEAARGLLGQQLGFQERVNVQEFDRFDFEGDGSLNFVECAKMFKGNMHEMQKRIGGAAVVPVPIKTPQEAGYQVGKVLASGGQGSVALATGPGSMGQVALKIYDKNNQNACSIEDLRCEMEVMQELERCPHIMHSYEIFQDAQHFYCVDELLPGGDLCCLREKANAERIQLDEVYFRNLFSQCTGALEYMHRHAMMHCDIKEPNIMFKSKDYRNPVIALIDFGMSKWSASDGMAGGTPGYRPPETNETNVWFPRGDIFSMGVTFFQLLADKVPDENTMKMGIFTEGAQSMEQANYFTATRQPPWYLIQGKFPGVMSWLPRMLDKQIRNRPTAPELFHKEAWFQGQGVAADAVMPETQWIMPQAMNDDDLADLGPAPTGQPEQPVPVQPVPVQPQAAPMTARGASRVVQPHEINRQAPQPSTPMLARPMAVGISPLAGSASTQRFVQGSPFGQRQYAGGQPFQIGASRVARVLGGGVMR